MIVELAVLALIAFPAIQASRVDDQLAFGVEFDVGAIHRARSGPFEVYAFAVITASVTRAFELVFAGLPVGSASEVGASGINHKQPFGVANYPDAVLLLEFRVDADAKITGETDSKYGIWLEDSTRQEELQEHEEVGNKEARDGGPDNSAAESVDLIGHGRALDDFGSRSRRGSNSGLGRLGWCWFFWFCFLYWCCCLRFSLVSHVVACVVYSLHAGSLHECVRWNGPYG